MNNCPQFSAVKLLYISLSLLYRVLFNVKYSFRYSLYLSISLFPSSEFSDISLKSLKLICSDFNSSWLYFAVKLGFIVLFYLFK